MSTNPTLFGGCKSNTSRTSERVKAAVLKMLQICYLLLCPWRKCVLSCHAEDKGVEPSGVTLARFSRPVAHHWALSSLVLFTASGTR